MVDTSISAIATRLESLTCRMEATLRRECDCSLSTLQREKQRLLLLLRANPPPRPAMLPQRRLRIAASQGWRCAICGEMLGEAFHADHKVPWSDTFDDSDSNVQIICVGDHLMKSSIEASCRRRRDVDQRRPHEDHEGHEGHDA